MARFVFNCFMHDVAAYMTKSRMTITKRHRVDGKGSTGKAAIGAKWVEERLRVRPNFNMLAAIGYAVNEVMNLNVSGETVH